MRYVLKSSVPFCVGAGGKICKRTVFSESPGFVQIQHLPVKNKAFSQYYLDCESPCPELCKRTVFPEEVRLELRPVPLCLPQTLVSEKTFNAGNLRCSARLFRQANCYSVVLDCPDFCETFVCDPLSSEVRLEVFDVGAPVVCVLEDERRLTMFSCEGDFKMFLSCVCSDFRFEEGRIKLRRHFPDARKRFCELEVRAGKEGLTVSRGASGFSARKKTFPELAPLYFLEALGEGFDEEAASYLDDSLQNADFEVVRAFFGNVDCVRLVCDKFAVEENGVLRFFFFDLEDGKISNFRN